MGDEERDSRTALGSSVDYKTLFLGACTLIVLLGGTAIRIWDSNNHRDGEDLNRKLAKLEERIADMEARQIEYRFRIDHLERAIERK